MRLMKLLAATLMLAFAGEAQAAKIFTVSGTLTPDQNGTAALVFQNNAMSGSLHFAWGVTARFSQPSTGSITIDGDQNCHSCWYIYDTRTQTYLDSNEGGVSWTLDFTNTTSVSSAVRIQPSGWTGIIYGQDGRNPLVSLGLTNMTGPVQYTMSGFNSVPEPATWALMILGFGGIGAAMRRRQRSGRHLAGQMSAPVRN